MSKGFGEEIKCREKKGGGGKKETFSDLLLFSFNREEERREKGLVKGTAYITTEVSAPATEPNHGQAFLLNRKKLLKWRVGHGGIKSRAGWIDDKVGFSTVNPW